MPWRLINNITAWAPCFKHHLKERTSIAMPILPVSFTIYANPQYHGLIAGFRDWRRSSYNRILALKPNRLKKQEVIEWFNDRINYEGHHDDVHKNLYGSDFNLDDDIG